MSVAKGQTGIQFNILPVGTGSRTLDVTMSDAEGGIVVGGKKSMAIVLAKGEGLQKLTLLLAKDVGSGRE